MPTSELPRKVGRNKTSRQQESTLILLFVGGNYAALETLLHRNGYTVVVPATADQAVALCPYNHIAATLVDRSSLAESDDWSLARSLKAVARNVPVLLIVSGEIADQQRLPPGVDLIVSEKNPLETLKAINQYRSQMGKRAG
jgi:hypothetical protein